VLKNGCEGPAANRCSSSARSAAIPRARGSFHKQLTSRTQSSQARRHKPRRALVAFRAMPLPIYSWPREHRGSAPFPSKATWTPLNQRTPRIWTTCQLVSEKARPTSSVFMKGPSACCLHERSGSHGSTCMIPKKQVLGTTVCLIRGLGSALCEHAPEPSSRSVAVQSPAPMTSQIVRQPVRLEMTCNVSLDLPDDHLVWKTYINAIATESRVIRITSVSSSSLVRTVPRSGPGFRQLARRNVVRIRATPTKICRSGDSSHQNGGCDQVRPFPPASDFIVTMSTACT
jgi:hypothetical protein